MIYLPYSSSIFCSFIVPDDPNFLIPFLFQHPLAALFGVRLLAIGFPYFLPFKNVLISASFLDNFTRYRLLGQWFFFNIWEVSTFLWPLMWNLLSFKLPLFYRQIELSMRVLLERKTFSLNVFKISSLWVFRSLIIIDPDKDILGLISLEPLSFLNLYVYVFCKI